MNTVFEFIFWGSLILIGYSYVVYPVFLRIMRVLRPAPDFVREEIFPKVSVVIAAYNEEKVIEGRIRNCLALDYPKDMLEIIIASDGSDDRTNAIVESFGGDNVVLKKYGERQGKVNVINNAIGSAGGEIIVLSDANTAFDKRVVRNLVRNFADRRVGCVCGRLIFQTPEGSRSGAMEGFYWRYETFLKNVEGRYGCLLGANGAIYAFRKELFRPCESDTIIDDFMIPMRILQQGYNVVYEFDAIAYEDTTLYVAQETQRRIRIGTGGYQAFFRLLPMLNLMRGFSAVAFWSHKVLRWFGPFFLVAIFVSNGLLCSSPGYRGIWGIQVVFYSLAVVGRILNHKGKKNRILGLCYYFVAINFALFRGFMRYVLGERSAIWQRTDR